LQPAARQERFLWRSIKSKDSEMTQFFGANKFKFGVFGLNCAGGMTPSRAPERWRANWTEMVKVAQMADDAGIEFLLPIAKWHGLGGEADMWGRSFETFTQAAALGALTENIGVFVTAHVSLLTPAFAAKAIATIDHVTNGRAGLNVVCGWNPDEFKLHGITLDGEHRYARGLEWFKIYDKLLAGGPDFDWKSDLFDMQGLKTDPLPVQPRPPVMSAAQSGDGQNFAAEIADILFTAMYSFEQIAETLERVGHLEQTYNRRPDVYVTTQFVCRPTRKEAEEYAHYYAVEMADPDAVSYFARQRAGTISSSTKKGETASDRAVKALSKPESRSYPGMFPSQYPLIGTPDDIVAQLTRLADMGVAGSTLVFLNYLEEMPYFLQEVLPRMEKSGLRRPYVAPSTS
jgi:alkanesulfonate monooxygenase SsuD/methylene tetrahydromethanopterin reductase-like flavin-dependent oxidoreductase (luciferase family)